MKPENPATESVAIIQVKRWLKEVVGLDRAIVFTIFARVWQSAAGLITIFLIARLLSPVQQGYYYTFVSLVALQIDAPTRYLAATVLAYAAIALSVVAVVLGLVAVVRGRQRGVAIAALVIAVLGDPLVLLYGLGALT